MPDEPAVQDVGAQAQALGADILAKLDELTQKPAVTGSAAMEVSLEERKRLAKLAIDKMDAIVVDYLAQAKSQQAAGAQEEIERIKASIGA
ncbi:MAG: hypothetical protein AAB375_01165 [Patescibacteria group bacterium]